MARKRMIDPSWLESGSLNGCHPMARLLFFGLISLSDDEGRLRGNCQYLRSVIFAYDEDITKYQVDEWLLQLQKVDSIIRSQVDSHIYIYLPKWLEYQCISKPTRSKLPQLPEKWCKNFLEFPENSQGNSGIPENSHSNGIEENRREEKGSEEKIPREILGNPEEIPFPENSTIQPEEKENISLPLFKKICFTFMKIYNHRNGQVMSPTGGNFTKAADIFRCENPEQLYNQAILVIDYFFETPFWFNTEKKEPGEIKKHLCTLGVFLAHLPAIIADYNQKKEEVEKKIESENTAKKYCDKMDELRKLVEEERSTGVETDQSASFLDPGG